MAAGIKAGGAPDLALVATADGRPVPTAAIFTANLAAAAPVQVSRAHLAPSGRPAAAVLVTSGQRQRRHRAPGAGPTPSACARWPPQGLGVAADRCWCARPA